MAKGFFTYFAARVGQKWHEAKKDISKPCNQVAAYHAFGGFYKDDLPALYPGNAAAKTV